MSFFFFQHFIIPLKPYMNFSSVLFPLFVTLSSLLPSGLFMMKPFLSPLLSSSSFPTKQYRCRSSASSHFLPANWPHPGPHHSVITLSVLQVDSVSPLAGVLSFDHSLSAHLNHATSTLNSCLSTCFLHKHNTITLRHSFSVIFSCLPSINSTSLLDAPFIIISGKVLRHP